MSKQEKQKSKKAKPKLGRKPIDPSKLKITVATRVSPRVLQMLKAQAEGNGVQLSVHIRNLCRAAVR